MDAEVRADISTDDFGSDGSSIRWRAAGRLTPLGGGQSIVVGTSNGVVDQGDPIELAFAVHLVPAGVHRTWFDLAVSPPVAAQNIPDVGVRDHAS